MFLHHTNFKHSFFRAFNCTSFLVAFLLLSACLAQAQGGGIDAAGTGGRHAISGRLVFPSGQRADLRLKVRLESPGYGDLMVLSDMNGSFSFQSLRPGNYTVVIEGGEFFETVRETVFIEAATVSPRRPSGVAPVSRPFSVQVYLRPKAQPNNAKAGVINAALAGVPKPAVELYNQAIESARTGDSDKAIEQLKKAVALYQSFGLALNELGVQYLKRGEVDKAAEVLHSAVSLSPEAFEPRLNYGIVLMNQKKFADAELHLREALRMNEVAFTPHLYLGISLINLKNYPEAETELNRAITLGGAKAAKAHYYLGGLYWRARDYQRAASQLEKYLELEPKAADADKVRATIKDLRNKS